MCGNLGGAVGSVAVSKLRGPRSSGHCQSVFSKKKKEKKTLSPAFYFSRYYYDNKRKEYPIIHKNLNLSIYLISKDLLSKKVADLNGTLHGAQKVNQQEKLQTVNFSFYLQHALHGHSYTYTFLICY